MNTNKIDAVKIHDEPENPLPCYQGEIDKLKNVPAEQIDDDWLSSAERLQSS